MFAWRISSLVPRNRGISFLPRHFQHGRLRFVLVVHRAPPSVQSARADSGRTQNRGWRDVRRVGAHRCARSRGRPARDQCRASRPQPIHAARRDGKPVPGIRPSVYARPSVLPLEKLLAERCPQPLERLHREQQLLGEKVDPLNLRVLKGHVPITVQFVPLYQPSTFAAPPPTITEPHARPPLWSVTQATIPSWGGTGSFAAAIGVSCKATAFVRSLAIAITACVSSRWFWTRASPLMAVAPSA